MSNKEIDNLIRDITKVGFMPKSEARRRIGELLETQKKTFLSMIEGMKIPVLRVGLLGEDGHCVGCGIYLDKNNGYACDCRGINKTLEDLKNKVEKEKKEI